MSLFFKFLLLKETAEIDETIIQNYSDNLLRNNAEKVHLDDFKTIVSLGRKYILRLPENERIEAMRRIQTPIKKVMALVKDMDQQELRKYYSDAFAIHPIEREMHLSGVVQTNQAQFEDFIDEAMNDNIDMFQLYKIISKNPEGYTNMEKSKRRSFILHLAKSMEETKEKDPSRHHMIKQILSKLVAPEQ